MELLLKSEQLQYPCTSEACGSH